MVPWDRSPFALSPEDLDVQEALTAIRRVLDRVPVSEDSRSALRRAERALSPEPH